jgi:hypothetical protein
LSPESLRPRQSGLAQKHEPKQRDRLVGSRSGCGYGSSALCFFHVSTAGHSTVSPRAPYRWAIDRGDNSLMPLAGSDRMPVPVNQSVAQPFCMPTISTCVRYAPKAVGCQPLAYIVRHSKQTVLVMRVGLHIRSAASGSASKAPVSHRTERVVSPSAASTGMSGWPRSPGRPPLARNTIFSPGPRVPSWISLMRPARALAV